MLSTFKTFDDSLISYTKIGNFRKPKVFMLHGFLGNRLLWVPYITPLLSDYYFVLMELRGHGTSHNNTFHSDNAIDDAAEDLWRLIQKETDEGEKIKLVGYSMGCLCSLRMMKKYGCDKIEKYIHIDHALEFMNHPDHKKRVFMDNHDKFFDTAFYIDEIIQKEPSLYDKQFLYNLPKPLIDKLMYLFDIVVTTTSATGIKTRFPFLNFINIPYFNHFVSTLINYPFRWNYYVPIGCSYKKTNFDYCEIVKNLPIDIIFMVGMNNNLFDSEYHIQVIKECKPDAKIIQFEKSGHDLMLNEPIRFYESLRNTLSGIEPITIDIGEEVKKVVEEKAEDANTILAHILESINGELKETESVISDTSLEELKAL